MTRRRPLERAFAFLAGDLNCCRSDEAHISDQTLNQLAATGKFPADENTFSASSFFSGEKLGGQEITTMIFPNYHFGLRLFMPMCRP